MNKIINKYIFYEITKGFLLIFFIFLSIAWLLQFTRLISLTNLIQVDIFTIFYLSIFLIPNLITIIIPFVIMFGLTITFLKLHKDRELISLFSLGLHLKSIKKPLIIFTMIIVIFLIFFNFYISPNVYKQFKVKEHEIRNKVNFEKIMISNFIEINKNMFLDFRKENKSFKEVFIKFSENNDNFIYAKQAYITQNERQYFFKLINGFKITIINEGKIEKLVFDEYSLEVKNESFREYDNFDKNTFNIFDDLKNKNYSNIFFKFLDILIIILIIIIFFYNNIRNYNFYLNNILFYIFTSSLFIIGNQILKNSSYAINNLTILILCSCIILILYILIGRKNV